MVVAARNESRRIVISYGFKPVLDELVDFERQLVIRASFGRLDDEPMFLVQHDPGLSRENYVEPADPLLTQIWQRHNEGEPPPLLRQSDACQRLFAFPMDIYRSTGEPAFSNAEWSLWLAAIKRAGFGEETLRDIIRAAIDHPRIEE